MKTEGLRVLRWWVVLMAGCAALLSGCARPGTELSRRGDEIVVCGRLFHTGSPVVLWTDAGGYDAYRTEKRFVPWERAAYVPPPTAAASADAGGKKASGNAVETPNRYSIRFASSVGQPGCPLSAEDFERIRGGGWDLATLQRCVDQFVLHYDVCGCSRQCFRVLHDMRGLSVHFMLDVDGTIYQTLDLKERAWHATTSNDRSIGVEIASIGAYPPKEAEKVLPKWYAEDERGTRVSLPQSLGDGGIRTEGFVGRPTRPGLVRGEIQGSDLVMYDLTPEQYRSLRNLIRTLGAVFPNIRMDYPRDEQGELLRGKLPDEQLETYQGVLGHYHIQTNKTDPGPAIQWDYLLSGARLDRSRAETGEKP